VDIRNLSHSLLLQESVVLIDFGQSYAIGRKPVDYRPAGPRHYLAPETYFDRQMSPAADVWAFGCVLFEIRAGSPLFDPFFDSSNMVLRQIVETLGRLPDLWWAAWDSPARGRWFEESGTPRSLDAQERAGPGIRAVATPLRQKLQEVGASDDPPLDDEGSLIEKTGTPLQLQEVELLADLLEKMLRYRPEDRITMQEVVRHPWFSYDSPTPAMLSSSK
jgi:serine/threonine-protein kinase SRPK3